MAGVILCGCGSIGRRHLENLAALGAEVFAVCEPNTSVIPDGPWQKLASIGQLGKRIQGQFVVIASPTRHHVEHAAWALSKGARAVLIEKPLATTYAEAKELEPWKDQIAVAFNYRFLVPLKEGMKQYLDDEGRKVLVISATDDISKWPDFGPTSYMLDPDQGGVLLTSASHSIDLAISLLGSANWLVGEITKIGALESMVLVRLTHDNGSQSIVDCSWLPAISEHSMVFGLSPHGVTVIDLMRHDMDRAKALMHLEMMRAFLAWSGGHDPGHLCLWKDAIAGMLVIDGLRKSSEIDGPVFLEDGQILSKEEKNAQH